MIDIITALWGALLLIIMWFLRYYMKQRFFNSILDNIPGPPSSSFWTGNLQQFFGRHGYGFHEELAQNYGSVVKIHGSFGRRLLYVFDPKALHTMTVKDQATFEEGSDFIKCDISVSYSHASIFTWRSSANLLVFGPGLLSTLGEQHRRQKKMLNPVFSINHMRRLLPIFYETVHQLRIAMMSEAATGDGEMDILDWMGRMSLELIGRGGLGTSFDSLIVGTKSDYGEVMKSTFAALQDVFILRPLLPYVSRLGPAWFRRRMVEIIPYQPVRKLKSLVDKMADRSTKIYQEKRAALRDGDGGTSTQSGEATDIMTILMKMNMVADDEDRLSDDEVHAQVSTMTLAATDTTSNASSRVLHLLAEHPQVQEMLRREIVDACDGDELSYDQLNRLPYLDAVLRETLRLYPPATLLSREATEDTVLPLSEPILGVDGQLIHEVPICKGTELFVGVLGSNTCKTIWGEDALEWKPERWLSPLPNTVIKSPIPGVYSKLMTFLSGKRSCIGFKFAELEIKVILSMLLPTFTFELTDKPITWNVATVYYPTASPEDTQPQLPLKESANHFFANMHAIQQQYWAVRDYLSPVLKESKFKEHGRITPEEFVAAGDFLAYKFPVWSWEKGDASKARDYLPTDKQYLVTRGVPCLRRATALAYTDADEDAERLLSIGDLSSTGNEADEWVETHAGRASDIDSGANPGVIDDIPDVDDHTGEGALASAMGNVSLSGANGDGVGEIPDMDEIPDMEEEDLEADDDEATAAPRVTPTSRIIDSSEVEVAKGNLLQVRTYDVMISYDKYYQTPRIWLIGYDEASINLAFNRTPLTPPQIFQDVSADHAFKTVTIEAFPHSTSLQAASVHPCKHASVMKKVIERMNAGVIEEQQAQRKAFASGPASPKDKQKKWLFRRASGNGKEDKTPTTPGEEEMEGMRVDFYLVVFLKFIASIVPTIEVDSTTAF
ncbi:uncharacterized protein FIBRA_00716 [Fibroporia radiculosa]|uniref:Autophagy-related protein 3 n=1 Tax=Fibroporia radiculosa TaxID=599839 RepID=J4HS26_9APHY|nr:uncharacterized protein FIBRA_00716 [Fibroporia radiculosa]CCL98712.1 predicted protein [Fibroporia radiculosa]